ncbi:TPA: hypothetical protein QCR24_006048 [Bacillus cereus]|nr:hypothetical protein [Bacillus cereus]
MVQEILQHWKLSFVDDQLKKKLNLPYSRKFSSFYVEICLAYIFVKIMTVILILFDGKNLVGKPIL